MKLGIMQPYFFPYLGYWQLLKAVDKYIIYDDVNYIKNGWINRNNILLNGKAHLITIPLDGASPFLPINQIKMTSNVKAKEKILKTIEQAYKKAPFFNQIFPIILDVIMDESCLICKALEKQFSLVSQYLGLNTQFILSSNINKNNNLKGQDKVIHICHLLGASEYINAIGGQKLYSVKDFKNEGISLKFICSKDINYKQFGKNFVPNLSIIDIMMFNSPEQINNMLDKYELIIP